MITILSILFAIQAHAANPTSVTGLTKCARYNDTCKLSGPATIRYGSWGKYVDKDVPGSVVCNNSSFPDPNPGRGKDCFIVKMAQPKYAPSENVNFGKLLRGFNLSGCEFGQASLCPNESEVDWYADAGATILRIPYKGLVRSDWSLNKDYLAKLKALVNRAIARKVLVIIDRHDYTWPSVADQIKYWSIVLPQFPHQSPYFGFDLMNEPAGGSWATWGAESNQIIKGIRKAGFQSLLLLEWRQSSGAMRADKNEKASKPCESAYCSLVRSPEGGLVDPAGMTVLSPHRYLDSNGSGTSDSCATLSNPEGAVVNSTDAAKKLNAKLILGEFAYGRYNYLSSGCESLGERTINHMAKNSEWVGVTIWGAGRTWKSNYIFRVIDEANKSSRTPYFKSIMGY